MLNQNSLVSAIFGFFVVLVLSPYMALLISVFDADQLSFNLLMPGGRKLDLFLTSIGYALSVAVISGFLGLMVALAFWSLRHLSIYRYRWMVFALIAVPPYLYALSWISVLTTLFNMIPTGWGLTIWVQTLAMLPIATGVSLLGLDGLDQQQLRAARVFKNDIHVFRYVMLPLLWPAILAGMLIIFLLSIVDYSVPSSFQKNIFSLELFAEYSVNNNPASVLMVAFPLILVSSLLIWTLTGRLRVSAQTHIFGRKADHTVWSFPAWFIGLISFLGLFFLTEIFILLLGLLVRLDGFSGFVNAVSTAANDIYFSLKISFIAAILTMPIAAMVAAYLVDSGSRWWIFVVALPLALPSSLTGVGLIELWSGYSGGIYGTFWMPVLALVIRFAPLAVLMNYAVSLRLDKSLLYAAQIHQPSLWKRLKHVVLPLRAPGIFAGGLVVFILSLSELGSTLIVVPPGSSTLAIRIFNYLHYGASSDVAALCLLLFVLAMTGILLIKIVLGSTWTSHKSTRLSLRETI